MSSDKSVLPDILNDIVISVFLKNISTGQFLGKLAVTFSFSSITFI